MAEAGSVRIVSAVLVGDYFPPVREILPVNPDGLVREHLPAAGRPAAAAAPVGGRGRADTASFVVVPGYRNRDPPGAVNY